MSSLERTGEFPAAAAARARASRRRLITLLVLITCCFCSFRAFASPRPGLKATVTSAGKSDAFVIPQLSFFQERKEPVTPFVPDGAFTMEVTGFISAEIRSIYRFRAELAGALTLTVNGVTVLEANGDDGMTEAGRAVRLNKGTNTVLMHFSPPPSGDAYYKIFWSQKNHVPMMLPADLLSHAPDSVLEEAAALRRGRALVAEFGCAKCHRTDAAGMPELEKDAPSFEGIGARLRPAWVANWVRDPAANRSSATMPKLLHGESAEKDSADIAAFLAEQNPEFRTPSKATPQETAAVEGQQLFQALSCGVCHETPGAEEKDPARVSLKHVSQKFQTGALAEYLYNPQAHYGWNRMPNFRLSEREADNLAAFLRSKSTAPAQNRFNGDPKRGGNLVQTLGCLNCHSLPVENRFQTTPFDELKNVERGCLASPQDGTAPRFAFSAEQQEDLRLFLRSGMKSLGRDNKREFAERQTKALNCAGCHGGQDGLPRLELLGGKLKPEWSAKIIGGQISEKPRPWLEARMPAFPPYAEGIARGLAMIHGFAPITEPAPPINHQKAEVGRRLVSAEGGFSCTSCHAVGSTAAAQVFETIGINLAYSAERLQKTFFHRWMMNPLAVDPTTKMPAYFDAEEQSPLADILEGDASAQIEAMWEYIRLGWQMPPPASP